MHFHLRTFWAYSDRRSRGRVFCTALAVGLVVNPSTSIPVLDKVSCCILCPCVAAHKVTEEMVHPLPPGGVGASLPPSIGLYCTRFKLNPRCLICFVSSQNLTQMAPLHSHWSSHCTNWDCLTKRGKPTPSCLIAETLGRVGFVITHFKVYTSEIEILRKTPQVKYFIYYLDFLASLHCANPNQCSQKHSWTSWWRGQGPAWWSHSGLQTPPPSCSCIKTSAPTWSSVSN